MATLAQAPNPAVEHERLFFFCMSLLLIASALLGFGYFQYAGISSWGAPWWVHVHAVSQMGWLGFFALQNALVLRGDVALHRRLGLLGAIFAVWLVMYGVWVITMTLGAGRFPPFFTPNFFLLMDWLNLAVFAALAGAAIRLRNRADWHKRLMLCAMAAMSLPSFGRILLMLDLSTTTNRTLFVLSFVAAGMAFDLHNRGKVHPAYFWGAGAVATMGLLIGGLPMLSPFVAFADGIAG